MNLDKLFQTPKGHASAIFGLMYASLIALSTLRGYFKLINLPWFVTQFSFMAVLGLGLVWVFISGDASRLNTSLNVMLFQMVPNLLILIYSVALWVSREEPLSLIMRGSSLIVYQLLLLAMLISAGAMFGKQCIEYTAFGFILANSLILLDVMRRLGVGNTITGMIQFLASAGSRDNNISRALEVQDVTFGIGILLVYYIVDGEHEHWRWFYIIGLAFYLILGFKRILFPAIALGCAYCIVTRPMKKEVQILLTVSIGAVLILISLGYVVLIRTGLWFDLCEEFGIDLMGRKRLYGYMESYYHIGPDYLGMGNGMVSTVLEVLEKTGNRRLHSDVLRMYIELGMPVFLLWCYITFIFTYTFLVRRYSLRPGWMYIAITLLMYITFLTDNTLEKYCPEIAWHVLPLGIVLDDQEKLTSALRVKPIITEREEPWKKLKSKNEEPTLLHSAEKVKKEQEEASSEKSALTMREFRLARKKSR